MPHLKVWMAQRMSGEAEEMLDFSDRTRTSIFISIWAAAATKDFANMHLGTINFMLHEL